MHPTSIPSNLERMDHGPGEFVIRFLGTNEHNWLTQRRVFYYRVSFFRIHLKEGLKIPADLSF